jgi:hypothetical protein
MFPAKGPIPLSGTEAGLVEYMDESLRIVPKQTRGLIRLLFWFVEHGPWIFGPLAPRFTRLTQEGRIRALARMAKSPLYIRRVAFLSLRTMLSLGYFANDKVLASIGCIPRLAPFEPSSAHPRTDEPASRPAVAL